MEVFWISGSPYSWRALLTLEIKGVPYVSRKLEAYKGELRTPEFRALNPRGRVPVLKDDSYVLSESIAIMAYLERKYPSPALFGRTEAETGRIWRSISECSSYFEPHWAGMVFPIFGAKFAEITDEISAAAENAHAELKSFERVLTSEQWLAGGNVTAADVALYPFVAVLERAAAKASARGLGLGFLPLAQHYPALSKWIGQIKKLPGYDKTYPPHWREADSASGQAT